MKLFSRFLSQSRNFGVAKTNAVFTVLSLISLAYLFAFIVFLLIPIALDKFLPGNPAPSEGMKIFVSVIIPIIITAFLALFSWDMVNARVSSAIDAGVDEITRINSQEYEREIGQFRETIRIQSQEYECEIGQFRETIRIQSQEYERQIEQLRCEVESYRRDEENSERDYEARQNLEFRSVVRSEVAGYENIESSLRKAIRERNARDSITRGLAYNEDLVKKIALKATKEIFCPKDSIQWIPDTTVVLFREDLYVYLSAWLMHSIANTRLMDLSIIEQRHPEKSKYIDAIIYIKTTLIHTSLVSKNISSEYSDDAILILDEYLGKLIIQLQSPIPRQTKY